MNQLSLDFERPKPAVVLPCDPSVTAIEQSRLSNQCRLILERLRQGPATNRELAAIALKYTCRLSEIRKAGYDVRIISRDFVTGLVVYQLFE